jgi:hypothetical protein
LQSIQKAKIKATDLRELKDVKELAEQEANLIASSESEELSLRCQGERKKKNTKQCEAKSNLRNVQIQINQMIQKCFCGREFGED